MSRLSMCAALALLAVLAQPTRAETPANEAQVQTARAAVQALADELRGRLSEAMKKEGPIGALSVCREAAQPVTRDVSVARGVDVRRTALRVRNPENAPSAREVEILKSFAERIKAGEDMAKIEHAEIVGSGGDRTHVYMKPIPMASEPCATCHGTDIKPEIRERISQLYPKDEARGFSAGELRGAFVVKQPAK